MQMDKSMLTEEGAKKICDTIRQVAYDLHVYLGVGYLEKVYENGLKHRLEKAGLHVDSQVPVKVCDEDGFVIGDYIADLVVEGVVIELKAASQLSPVHVAQCLNYLKAMDRQHGMIINFGSFKFQCQKIVRSE